MPTGRLLVPLLGLCLMSLGCGVHYYNPRTGVEHLWGFGHLRMRHQPPTNGVEAVITGYRVVGIKVGGSQEEYGLSLGYDDRRLIYIDPSHAVLNLEWPNAGFFNIRITTNAPVLAHNLSPTNLNHESVEPP